MISTVILFLDSDILFWFKI